jgi:RNase P/RNase MRP subunit p30
MGEYNNIAERQNRQKFAAKGFRHLDLTGTVGGAGARIRHAHPTPRVDVIIWSWAGGKQAAAHQAELCSAGLSA